MSDATTVIVYGPAGCGKTKNAERLRAKYGCWKVFDDVRNIHPQGYFSTNEGLQYGAQMRGGLLLTSEDPDALAPWALKLHAIAIPFAAAMDGAGIIEAAPEPEAKPADLAQSLEQMRALYLQDVAANRDGLPRPTLQELLDDVAETAQETTADEWWPEQSLDLQLLVWHIQARTKCFDAELLGMFNHCRKAATADPMPLDPPPDDAPRDAVLADMAAMLKDMNTRLSALEDLEAVSW